MLVAATEASHITIMPSVYTHYTIIVIGSNINNNIELVAIEG